jgi:hypothetical protein
LILYTPLAADQVLNGMENAIVPPVEIRMGEAILQVQPIGARQAKIVRLISPDAQAYLNPGLAPGTVIEWEYRIMY